jgi:hypothetical protein
MVYNTISKLFPKIGTIVFGEGLNKRLNTTDLTMTEAILYAAMKGISVGNLFAIPEQDDWVYSDGKSYICIALTSALYRASGVFKNIKFNPQELTPRDLYQLAIFDRGYKHTRSILCKKADPELEYCQIMGTYKIVLENYSSKSFYDNMADRCQSVGPLYIRTDNC